MVGIVVCGKCEYFVRNIFGHEVIPIKTIFFYIVFNIVYSLLSSHICKDVRGGYITYKHLVENIHE